MTKRILLIDDNDVDRKLIVKALINTGYDSNNILIAESGEEGVLKIKENKPEMVLLDTLLPGMDGFETCRQIKNIDSNVKVIILTGSMDALDREKAAEAGADEYTVKGLNYGALKEVISKLNE